MRSSYKKEDVIWLLKDITGLVEPSPAEERERLIQSGRHYCEMLPLEYVPSTVYMKTYEEALRHFAAPVAAAVEKLSEKIMKSRGNSVVLVSLARAGTPVGILIKRCIRQKYGISLPHYSLSIIRGRGIDHNAMAYLLSRYQAKQLLFVDGWIGKGAILGELEKETKAYEGVSSELAVVADPANMTELCGTHEDILIPSSCLNSTVSGLVSRTFLRNDIIGPEDFHGAVFYGELADSDLSEHFIQTIEAEFGQKYTIEERLVDGRGIDEVKDIALRFEIQDLNFIKPGIGETTRVLLRRIPWKILIRDGTQNDPSLTHLIRLAEEKQVPIEFYPLRHYKACGLIRKLADI